MKYFHDEKKDKKSVCLQTLVCGVAAFALATSSVDAYALATVPVVAAQTILDAEHPDFTWTGDGTPITITCAGRKGAKFKLCCGKNVTTCKRLKGGAVVTVTYSPEIPTAKH